MTRRTILLIFAAAACAGAETMPTKCLGNPQSPLTIEVFSDYQCPACKMLYEGTLMPVIEDYVKKGKVYLIHRDYPLPMHQYARTASLYACAAERVGKYEAVARALFRDQDKWSKDGAVEASVATALTAEELKKVREGTKDPKVAAEIDQDTALGKQANVQQTPTMVVTQMIRRFPVAGVVQYQVFSQFLDKLLSGR